MTRIDHASEANIWIKNAIEAQASRTPNNEQLATAYAAMAQATATLALVEQQRIANLIAVEAATEPRDHASYLLHNAQTDKDATFPIWELRPDIAAALGLTAGQEGETA